MIRCFLRLNTFCWFLVVISPWVIAQNDTLQFQRLGIDEGLSQSVVTSIAQDAAGFLWFGTQDGLNRYDGHQFKIYRNTGNQSGKDLYSSSINHLLVDHNQRLWIGTDSGLNWFDISSQVIKKASFPGSNPEPLANVSIDKLFQDSKNLLWVTTFYSGLYLIDLEKGLQKHWSTDELDRNFGITPDFLSFAQVSENQLWASSEFGILAFDYKDQTFTDIDLNNYQGEKPPSFPVHTMTVVSESEIWVAVDHKFYVLNPQAQTIRQGRDQQGNLFGSEEGLASSIYCDSLNYLWMTYRRGVIQINPERTQQRVFFNNPNALGSMGREVITIYEDRSGVLWFGSYSDNLLKLPKNARYINYYGNDLYDPKTLADNSLRSLYVDREGRIMAGHFEGGLSISSPGGKPFQRLVKENNNPNSLPSNSILDITELANGNIWISTLNGIAVYTKDFKRIAHLSREDNSPIKLVSDLVYGIYEDTTGRIWIGSSDGVQVIDGNGETLEVLNVTPENPQGGLVQRDIMAIQEDALGNFWFGSFGGLTKYNPEKKTFSHYTADSQSINSLCHNMILSIDNDSKGNIWISTAEGLNRYQPETDDFLQIGKAEQFPNLTIYGVIEDRQGYLWMSTNTGIIRFDVNSHEFLSFDNHDGFQSNEFNQGALATDLNGLLYFGGINGLNVFDPVKLSAPSLDSPIVLTDFLLRNQPTLPSKERGLLDKAIFLSEKLTIPYKEYLFGFEFSSLDYNNPNNTQFAYMLKGLDEDWIFTDSQNRRATYTKLQPGDYTFMVKTKDLQGQWSSQHVSLPIQILPPFYRTPLAYLLYVLAGAGLIFGIYAWRINGVKTELKRERVVNERLQQLNRLKDDFLANTSHELRTPLNGIIGLAESLKDGAAGQLPQKAHHNLGLIVQSSKRLSYLVDDLLDFSSLKSQLSELKLQPLDIKALTDVITTTLTPVAKDKGLELVNAIPDGLPTVRADEDRLQQVLFNLVGNAIKFTPSGKVEIGAKEIGDQVELSVIDTGPGIPENEMDLIFESFERGSTAAQNAIPGTGLGLSLAQKLVQLHGDQILVENNPTQGATFRFRLDSSESFPTDEHLSTQYDLIETLNERTNSSQVIPDTTFTEQLEGKNFRILIVDDDPINLQVLIDHLSIHYRHVTSAANGQEALDIIDTASEPFDLVILDIMMPLISGYEVCRRLRQRFPIHELPVIFLTAKNQLEDLVSGFDAGGNDYLTKPVTKMELLQRVRTQIRLLDANRNLEYKVAERTQQLATKNEELAQLNQALEQASFTDPLTQLGNRRYLRKYLNKEVALVHRIYANWQSDQNKPVPNGNDLLFLLFDLDHFKSVNDTYGHLAGDKVLQQIRMLMEQVSRDYDILVRWGGEEFLIVFRNADRSEAAQLAQRLRSAINNHAFDIGVERPLNINASIGLAPFPFLPHHPNLLTWEEVINIADQALYLAKKNGRDAWVVLDSNTQTPAEDLLFLIRHELDQLAKNKQLQLLTSIEQPGIKRWGKSRTYDT